MSEKIIENRFLYQNILFTNETWVVLHKVAGTALKRIQIFHLTLNVKILRH